MSSSHPITAGGAAAEYTHKFKKHFGDRPTSFALSGHSATSRTSSSSSSSIPASLVMDPFAASASTSTPSFPRPPSSSSGSAPSTPSTSSTIQQTFAPASATTVGPSNLDNDKHNTLANLGYRIRARVNQGYLRTSSSSTVPFGEAGAGGGGFRSERDVLANVTNTRRGWSRVSTAPSVCTTFDGLRGGTEAMDTDMDTTSKVVPPAEVAFKRGRSVDSDLEEEQEESPQSTQNTILDPTRRIAGMPKLSFTSSTSSSCSFSSSLSSEMCPPSSCTSGSSLQPKSFGVGGRSLSRSKSSSTSPFTSDPNILEPNFSTATGKATGTGTRLFVPCEDEEMSSLVHSNNIDVNLFATEPATGTGGGCGYDFSTHFDRTDF
ncbi:uncharacterized protein UTRI_05967 [Ustilago trichophora]|uniref:Uncharacterized protein n=1 Tax=Ustilago trichophora TaxID=86804 RepID=A0A5C3EHU1_9BASI|nr:uncharacterized protein UTRI_05967 [Ustilago trichophora]